MDTDGQLQGEQSLNKQNLAQEIETTLAARMPANVIWLEQTESRSRD